MVYHRMDRISVQQRGIESLPRTPLGTLYKITGHFLDTLPIDRWQSPVYTIPNMFALFIVLLSIAILVLVLGIESPKRVRAARVEVRKRID